jgi:broad specificity phosphatase PhoE
MEEAFETIASSATNPERSEGSVSQARGGSFASGSGFKAVVVSHGTAIRLGATVLLGTPIALSRNLAQDNAAINIFDRRSDRYVLRLWNDTTHCQ